ncbi:uncharacterized protein LOC109543640 isoform X1 [Dendroctonus ponderosae]|uniref:uncharacterized protein LOC109543640 isoform X1 n=2 Tax=Dendroctonus ponderosae TaxID=77166 RepID=UPI0020353149|nr:uncharacterized protein LOC109543640 isoform X1 [Dendroctonus ponderosae]XP_048520611.1 uncharacterized protein LOC109543640 isoform X1 [Dendroctonus ponderosae]KAH1023930.1 hypothetical protein HUJ05_003504 [Dendroctonus ponderosae]
MTDSQDMARVVPDSATQVDELCPSTTAAALHCKSAMNESTDNAVYLKSEQLKPETVNKNNTNNSSIGNGSPKNKSAENSKGSDAQACVNSNGPKRKRGRPPKIKNNTVDSSMSMSSESQPASVNQRKRRSTKNTSKFIFSDSDDDDDMLEKKSKCKKLKMEDNVSNDGAVEDENKQSLTKTAKENQSEEGDKNHTVDQSNGIGKEVPKKKRAGSGYTALAINHIFQTLAGSTQADSSGSSQVVIEGKIGRPKINNDSLLDENGESICMVCNETIVNTNWLKHKRKVHYNLTWRQGETPMDILNTQVIQKVLTQLRKEQGYLKCNKCGSQPGGVKAFMTHLEKCHGIVSETGLVICAVCKVEMPKDDWSKHKYKEHNNLTWREGETPLNLQDQNLVTRILGQLCKLKKPLHCETCKQQKKSVLGYLSHKSICQLNGLEAESIKAECKLCGKKMMPVSLSWHMKTHTNETTREEPQKSDYFKVETPTNKRRAATDAARYIRSIKGESIISSKYYVSECDFQDQFVISKLKKIAAASPELDCIFNDCSFKTDSVNTMGDHLNNCSKKPEQYIVCKLCLFWAEDETSVKDHLKMVHNRSADVKDAEFGERLEESGSEADELMEEIDVQKKKLNRKAKGALTQGTNSKVKPMFLMHPIREDRKLLVYAQAYPWMLSFCKKYYTNSSLFDCFRNRESWQVLDCDILIKYLPRIHESCDITVKTLKAAESTNIKADASFTKLGLFEHRNFYDGEATLYCGGPVSNLAWLPTPFNEESHDQILAVSVFNDGNADYSVDRIYNEPHIIQFWKIENLDFNEKSKIASTFLFGLAVNAGPIWHMEWCPSGCLDTSEGSTGRRLGLLAVATADYFVDIYCVDDLKNESDRGLVYSQKPVAKLQLEDEKAPNGLPYYATKISWTKANGHRYIAVGYSNGMIALYDLNSTSSLLRRQDQDDVTVILSSQTFHGHVSCIIGLTLSHYDNGNRFCFSTSLDKVCIYWDLSNNTKVSCSRKFGIADGQWLTQWPACLIAEDESTFNDKYLAQTLVKPIRGIMSGEYWTRYTFSQSGIKSVSFSDWLNLILHGGNAGDVMGLFAHRLFFNIDSKHFKKCYVKCLFSTSKLVKKDNSSSDSSDVATYGQAAAHYGLAFLDYNSGKLTEIPNSNTNDVKRVKVSQYNIHDYPLQAVTKVALNPNLQYNKMYATGHQAGFVRIRSMTFVKNNLMSNTFTEFNLSESL